MIWRDIYIERDVGAPALARGLAGAFGVEPVQAGAVRGGGAWPEWVDGCEVWAGTWPTRGDARLRAALFLNRDEAEVERVDDRAGVAINGFHERRGAARISPSKSLVAVACLAVLAAALIEASASHAEEQPPPAVLEAATKVQRACDDAVATADSLVFIADGAACFYGPITRESADAFLRLPIPGGMPLMVNIPAGEVDSSLDVAERILDRRMPIVVPDGRVCVTVCADYLFPAAVTKTVLPGGFVAWNGMPPREQDPAWSEETRERHRRAMTRQQAFFQRIGVAERLIYDPDPASGLWRSWSADELRKRFGMQGVLWMWLHPDLQSPENTGAR